MTFHTAPQFHATISHHTLFFTTPFCTTLDSVVHPHHRHSISYDIPFYITPYNKYISSVVSFNSALNTHLFSSGLWLFCLCAWSCMPLVSCVCVSSSGHILHHKCCSVHVISRVQIAFHASHHIKHFHSTHHSITANLDFTSHHHSRESHHSTSHGPFQLHHITIAHCHITRAIPATSHHHCTSHYYIPHIPRHISQTFNVATHLASDHRILHPTSLYTVVCHSPPFHTTAT